MAFRVSDVVHADAVLGESGRNVVFPKRVFGRDHFVRGALDGVECLSRAQAVRADVARLALDLLFDARDANFEKLVQVRTENGQELDAFDQRLGRILRFLQNAPVEFEPAQLAINEIFRRGKAGGRRCLQTCLEARRYSTVLPASSKVPISDSSLTVRGELIAKSDGFSEALEKAALFLLSRRCRRPAFHDFEREEAKESEARKLEIQAKILRDLGDGADAIELRSELSFGDGEPKFLDALVTIARVGRNAAGFRFRCLQQFLKLDTAQSGQDPVIDVSLARDVLAVFRQGLALLENETDLVRGPELREKFLAVMLHQLHRRLVKDQFLLREGQENRATGLSLLRAGLLGLFGVDIDERDRRFRAIELRIARGHEDDFSVSREKLDRLLCSRMRAGCRLVFLFRSLAARH